jgi:DNA-binding CsgD family transcriptional regulator
VSGPNGCPLTRRQLEALKVRATTETDKEVGARLGITTSTVRQHLYDARRLAGVANTFQLLLLAEREGWLNIEVMNSKATPIQRLYLEKFDAFLREKGTARALAWEAMGSMARAVRVEAGARPSQVRRDPDPMVRILNAMGELPRTRISRRNASSNGNDPRAR